MTTRLRSGRRARNPWLGVDPGVDPLKLAKLLRRAHGLAQRTGSTSPLLRSVVASSWRRAQERGVDPAASAPKQLGPEETERALQRHPLSPLLPIVEPLLVEAADEARYFAALSDPTGVLLWADGNREALDAAAPAGFLPGHLCSESAVGTNAVGTAIEIDHPVQIFSAEHFNVALHGMTCSAAPVHDPETGAIIGVLDISGHFRGGHPHSLALVSAAARILEERLAGEAALRTAELKARYAGLLAARGGERAAIVAADGRVLAATPSGWLGARVRVRSDGSPLLPAGVEVAEELLGEGGTAVLVRPERHPDRRPPQAISVELVGPRRARVAIGDWETVLSPRHTEIVVLLALNPDGLGAEELRSAIYPRGCSAVTLRAEVSRLRRLLGVALQSDPYRLASPVDCDRESLKRALPPPSRAGR